MPGETDAAVAGLLSEIKEIVIHEPGRPEVLGQEGDLGVPG